MFSKTQKNVLLFSYYFLQTKHPLVFDFRHKIELKRAVFCSSSFYFYIIDKYSNNFNSKPFGILSTCKFRKESSLLKQQCCLTLRWKTTLTLAFIFQSISWHHWNWNKFAPSELFSSKCDIPTEARHSASYWASCLYCPCVSIDC